MIRDSEKLKEILQSVSDVLFPEFIGEKKVDVNSCSSNGDSPLHVIVLRNELESVKILLQSGADPNAVGDMGETPLHVAVANKNVEIIDELLKYDANRNIKSEFGETPLEKASRLGVTFPNQ